MRGKGSADTLDSVLGNVASPLVSWAPQSYAIWLDSVWLGDELEHSRDRWVMRNLLAAMEQVPVSERFNRLQEKVIAWFRVHVLMQPELHAMSELRPIVEHLFTLIEQLERTGIDDPLYLSQSASLRFGIALSMTIESELRATRGVEISTIPDPVLLTARGYLLEQICGLLRSTTRRRVRKAASASKVSALALH